MVDIIILNPIGSYKFDFVEEKVNQGKELTWYCKGYGQGSRSWNS